MSKCGAGADHSQIHPTYMTICSALANTQVKETSCMIGFPIGGDGVFALNSLGYILRRVWQAVQDSNLMWPDFEKSLNRKERTIEHKTMRVWQLLLFVKKIRGWAVTSQC